VLESWVVVLASFGYIALLFAIAFYAVLVAVAVGDGSLLS